MSTIGDNSMWKADELREAIDTRCEALKTSVESIQEVAIHAVLHVVEHGDTTFGTRIYQKMPNGVKSNDFKNWFEDHAGCEWDKASFKLVRGKAQTSNYIKLGASLWYKYKRDASAKPYDFAKALRNIVKATQSETKALQINPSDPNQRAAWMELLNQFDSLGFTESGDPDFVIPTKDAVGF